MTYRNLIRRSAALLCALLLVFTMATGAFAYGAVDVGADASLTVTFKDGETALSGVEFRVYKVADVSKWMRYTLTADFAPYGALIADLNDLKEDMTAGDWDAIASTLVGFVEKDGLKPVASARTDKNGQAKFANLTPGLYLVVGDSVRVGNKVYTSKACLVALPQLMADDTWNYDGQVFVKADVKIIPPDETVKIKVIKVWDDDNWEGRPDEIEVTLLKDGKVYDTVTLSAKNNWRYTWAGLPAGHRWQVVEDVPKGYTVTVDRDGDTFIIENDHETPPEPVEPELPSTGQLWWPVLPLAMAGLILVIAGVRLSRKRHEA